MNIENPDNSDEFGVPVHVFDKSPKQQIRISINEFRGTEYVDIRTFYLFDEGFRPTKRGITLTPELIPEFLRGMFRLADTLGIDIERMSD